MSLRHIPKCLGLRSLSGSLSWLADVQCILFREIPCKAGIVKGWVNGMLCLTFLFNAVCLFVVMDLMILFTSLLHVVSSDSSRYAILAGMLSRRLMRCIWKGLLNWRLHKRACCKHQDIHLKLGNFRWDNVAWFLQQFHIKPVNGILWEMRPRLWRHVDRVWLNSKVIQSVKFHVG